MIKESFVLRVLVVLFIFLALPLLIACFIMFQRDYEVAINNARKVLETAATNRTHSLYHIKPFSNSFVGEVAFYLDLKNKMPKEDNLTLSATLKKIAEISGQQITLFIAIPGQERGEYPIVASSDPDLLKNTFTSFSHLPSISHGGETTFVRTVFSEVERKYRFYNYVIQAILGEQDQLLGYLIIRAKIDSEIEKLIELGREAHPEYKFAVTQKDTIVVETNDPQLLCQYFKPIPEWRKKKFILETGQKNATSPCLAAAPLPINAEKNTAFFEFEINREVQLAYLPLPHEFGIAVLAYSPKEIIFRGAMKRFLIIYNAYGALLIVGGAVSYALSLLMARPLKQLSTLMKRVGQGDLEGRYQEERFGYEINSLGQIFNQTLDTLLDNIQRAENYRVTKETNQKELEIGYQVQRRLLPEEMPDLPEVELAARYLSSSIAGGDFYDFIVKNNDHLFLVVGDVASVGITPCLYALVVRSLIRSYTYITEDVGKILTATNTLFCKDTGDTGMYVTLLMAHYDLKTREFSYYSCGHVPAIIRRANGHLEELTHRGMALGLKEGSSFVQTTLRLEPGDLVLFYTDGLIHSLNEEGRPFSLDRLFDCLQHRKWETAQEVVSGLENEIQTFYGEKISDEEKTFFAMRVL